MTQLFMQEVTWGCSRRATEICCCCQISQSPFNRVIVIVNLSSEQQSLFHDELQKLCSCSSCQFHIQQLCFPSYQSVSQMLLAYLSRLSAIADNKINCGPALTWMEVHLLPVPQQTRSLRNVELLLLIWVCVFYRLTTRAIICWFMKSRPSTSQPSLPPTSSSVTSLRPQTSCPLRWPKKLW